MNKFNNFFNNTPTSQLNYFSGVSGNSLGYSYLPNELVFGFPARSEFGANMVIKNETFVVAAPFELSKPDSYATAFYIFTGNGNKSSWKQAARLTGSVPYKNNYGLLYPSLAAVPSILDINSQENTIAAAASSGCFIFTGSKSNWSEAKFLPGKPGYFTTSPKFNDQGNILALGMPWGPGNTGQICIFTGSGSNWNEVICITGTRQNNYFGYRISLSPSGDVLAVGDPDSNFFSGTIEIYTGFNGNFNKNPAKILSGNFTGRFGDSISLKDNVLAVRGNGAGYIYTGNKNNWEIAIAFGGVYPFRGNVALNNKGDTLAVPISAGGGRNLSHCIAILTGNGNNWDLKATTPTGISFSVGQIINGPMGEYNCSEYPSFSICGVSPVNLSNFNISSNSLNNSGDLLLVGEPRAFTGPNITGGAVFIYKQKLDQNITFPSIPIKFITDPIFNLNVTSTNNTIPITYSSSNTSVATVSSNGTVSIVGVGTTTITANQAGDSNYNAANPVSRGLYVSPGCYNYSQISAGVNHSFALLKDGRVTGWGRNDVGQINAPPSLYSSDAPPSIQGNVAKIDIGYYHTLALLKDGRITGWGAGAQNLNDGANFGQTNIPVGIGTNATGISAGLFHSLALLKDGSVTGWGRNDAGQIDIPAGIGTNATGISAGSSHSLALLKDGTVTGWGANVYGQINIPVGIGTNATAIAGGDRFSLALLKDGSVTGWGQNTTSQINIPVEIGNNAIEIDTIGNHSLALLKDGSVIGWGRNVDGEINIPTNIQGNVTGISAGGGYSLALLKDGSVTGWGTNQFSVINAPKCSQTLTFPSILTKVFGDPSFNLNVTSTNNTIPITYSSSNTSVATVSSNGTVTIVGVGTSTITASQSGNNIYDPASVSQTLTVNKTNQTITFPVIPTKTFGDPSFNPSATASSNLPVSYSSSNTSIATVVGSLVNIVGAGTVTITANQVGDSNYNPAPAVGQTLTVNKTNQTITFPVIPTKTFGDANFSLGVTSNNNTIAITYSSSNTSVATVSSNGTVTIVGAGTSAITANQAGDNNYDPASASRTLTVDKMQSIIIFPSIPLINKTITPIYNLNATSNNNQTPITYISSNTSVATVNGNVLTILTEGSSTITATQIETSNYLAANSVIRTLQVVTIRNPNILKVSNLPNGVYYDEETQYLYGNITDEGNYHTKIYIKEGDRICEKTLKLMVYNPNKKYIYKINYPMNVGFIKYNAPDRIGLKDYIEVYKTSNGDVLRHSRYGVIYAYTGDNIIQ